jgi:hypothetical protein
VEAVPQARTVVGQFGVVVGQHARVLVFGVVYAADRRSREVPTVGGTVYAFVLLARFLFHHEETNLGSRDAFVAQGTAVGSAGVVAGGMFDVRIE